MKYVRGMKILQPLTLGAFGIKYDATAMQTALLVEEMKNLRQTVHKYVTKVKS